MAGGGRSVPGGAPAVEKLLEVSRWGVGGGVPLCGARAFPGTRRPPGAAGGRYRVAGPVGSPLCVPPTRCVPPCSPSRPNPLCVPIPSSLWVPLCPPTLTHSVPPASIPTRVVPLYPSVPTLCVPPVPTRSVPRSRSASRGQCPGLRGRAEPARAVLRRAGSAGGGRRIPGGQPGVSGTRADTLPLVLRRMGSASCSRAALP